VAIGPFATSQIIFMKEHGIGVATGVPVDATIQCLPGAGR
jgi:hypothetical protein